MAEIITTCGKAFAEECKESVPGNADGVPTLIFCTPLNMCNVCVADCADCGKYRSACAPHRGITRDG